VKSAAYEEEDVYVTSCYLETGNVGLNDNNIPLTAEHKALLDNSN